MNVFQVQTQEIFLKILSSSIH